MSEWITDRRPTEDDGMIWVCTPSYGPVLTEWNDCGSFPWMPCPAPEPYQPPEPDTSLSASIERVEANLKSVMEDHYQVAAACDCEYCDRIRTLEAARKWDAMANKGKCIQGFSRFHSVKCNRCGIIQTVEMDQPELLVSDCHELLEWTFNTEDGWVCPYCNSPDDYTPPKPEKVSTLIGIEPKELARLKEIESKYDQLRDVAFAVAAEHETGPVSDVAMDQLRKELDKEHDDIGESEAGRKYEERTGATSYNELFGLCSHPKDPSMAVSSGENCGAEGQAETQPRERSSNPQDKPIEHGTSSGDKQQAPVVSSGDKPKRRE